MTSASTEAAGLAACVPDEAAAVDRLSVGVFGLFLLALVPLQKIAVLAGEPVSLSLPLVYAGLLLGILTLRVRVSPGRLVAFAAFVTAALVALFLSGVGFSAPSFALLMAIYLPFALVWPMRRATYEACLRLYQNVLLVAAGLVLLQLAASVAPQVRDLLNLERYVPSHLLLPGYNYWAPIRWGSDFIRPNGVVFLEPSFAGIYLACALIFELTVLHRIWRVAVYAAAVAGCMSGTGLFLVALAAPWILAQLPRRSLPLQIVLGGVGLAAVLYLKVGASLLQRVEEFGKPGSSAWSRFIEPLYQMQTFARNPMQAVTGAGPGNVPLFRSSPWPVTKLFGEYGALCAATYFVLLLAAVWKAPNRGLAFALFVVLNFTGGYLLNPLGMFLLLVLAALPRPLDEEGEAAVAA